MFVVVIADVADVDDGIDDGVVDDVVIDVVDIC